MDSKNYDSMGVLASAMVVVNTPMQVYILRFLLGIAEAGFSSGIILYLTYWDPVPNRAKASATFMSAVGIGSCNRWAYFRTYYDLS